MAARVSAPLHEANWWFSTAASRLLSLGGHFDAYAQRVSALHNGGGGSLPDRAAGARSLAASMRHSGAEGEARVSLDAAAGLLDAAQNAKVEAEFRVVSAQEDLQDLIDRLWPRGPWGELQVAAAMGVLSELDRVRSQAVDRLVANQYPGAPQVPGAPQQDGGQGDAPQAPVIMWPSPLVSANTAPAP